jgi:hypothetical protein
MIVEVIWMALAEITYTHTGNRYVLGYGTDFYGIWDRESPSDPTARFPRTPEGWGEAWQQYVALEPGAVTVATAPVTASPPPAAPVPQPVPAVAPPSAPPVGWRPTPAGGWQQGPVTGGPLNPLAPIALALAAAGAVVGWFWSGLGGLGLALVAGILAGIARKRIRAAGGSGAWMAITAQVLVGLTAVMFVLMVLSVFGATT